MTNKIDKEVDSLFNKALITLALAGIIFSGGAYVGYRITRPREVEIVRDLNRDGIEDISITEGQGHKRPFYSTKQEDGNVRYLSASEINKAYKGIEEKLNSVE